MDSVSSLTPVLPVEKLQLAQNNKQQHPPFSRGQILQGLITGKENDQFILNVKGEQFLADSKAPLQVGQKLELQVTALSPRISLQVLTDPLTQNIGKSLHLLPTEGQLQPRVASLAAQLPANALSPPARQTLTFYSSLAMSNSDSTGLPQQAGHQLTQLLINIFSSPNTQTQQNGLPELQNFINQLTQSLPPQHQSSTLVQLVQQELSVLEQNVPLQYVLTEKGNPTTNTQLNVLLQNISQLTGSESPGQNLTELILQFMRSENRSPAPLLQELLSLTEDLLRQDTANGKVALSGKELEQFINRLGTNLEQLLATGRQDEATQTLKSALLEISHNFSGESKIQSPAEQLTATIQLYQMLQVRLANEALIFLPLPLSFLNQGFLLVEPEHKQDGDPQQSGEKKDKYSLHLNLEGLGNLQIDLHQQAAGMRLRFYAEDTERAKFLADNRDDLKQRLTATTLESVQFLTGAQDPAKKLLSKMTHGRTSLLNTRV